MWHFFVFGLLLGWGAAIPIGPINIEIIRRNLRFGMFSGLSFGFGACSADVTYFILLLSGVLVFLQRAIILRMIGVAGSLILIWFAISAFKLRPQPDNHQAIAPVKNLSVAGNYFHGYLLTLLNPMTILFWASLSAQLVNLSHNGIYSVVYAGIGVLVGTFSWATAINTVLHFTRHRLSPRTMQYLNYLGGFIILCFAIIGLWRAFYVN